MNATDLSCQEEIQPLTSTRFYQHYLAKFGGTGEDIAMVLDDCGKVLFCSPKTTEIFGIETNRLITQPIRDLIPAVPFNTNSPGSNVVNAAYVGRQNQWQEYHILNHSRQASSLVELLFDVMMIDFRYVILLRARIPTVLSGAGMHLPGQVAVTH